MTKEIVLNSATESSCHHNFFVYLAKHLYEVTKHAKMNKAVVISREESSGQRSARQKGYDGDLTPEVVEIRLNHSLRSARN